MKKSSPSNAAKHVLAFCDDPNHPTAAAAAATTTTTACSSNL